MPTYFLYQFTNILYIEYITVSVSIPSLATPAPISNSEAKPALNSFIVHCKSTQQGVS